MSANEQTRFLQALAEDLNSRNFRLPSFPDVVITIRTALEYPKCSSERLADVVCTDPVLNARLLMAANSAFHNRAGIEIVDLNLAVSRLGFEVVRNTAITLAVEQIFAASKHEDIKSAIEAIWISSLSLASMSFVIARSSGSVKPDSAFLCGLLHEVGKLYVLTRASNYPELLGDDESLSTVLEQWAASVGKSIIEAWGFSDEIAESFESEENRNDDPGARATQVDVVYFSKQVLNEPEGVLGDENYEGFTNKMNVNAENLPGIQEACQQHAASMRP